MDLRKVKKLIELLNESGVGEIEITEGDDSVRISRESTSIITPSQKTQKISTPPENKEDQIQKTLTPKETNAVTKNINQFEVLSPMVGTFYASPSPDEPPYVKVGDTVKQGDTLCIIEAMKMMNQIEADVNGVIKSIKAQNGDPIEYDQIIFVIDQD
ncbi:MAG: acetyl-CoA carboxylase, biotin carboxyl carrier protein [Woeseiaceae bacterium]|nr:acetyl-CoA carboxylase, biotin carboxyl carrier protein [Woeseiaceae bacterium]|tara:strand:- start:8950 stop:9420 length:471 start_codon:yes stop_codon:yes gene_type:complete